MYTLCSLSQREEEADPFPLQRRSEPPAPARQEAEAQVHHPVTAFSVDASRSVHFPLFLLFLSSFIAQLAA